jgi:8-oxo-dGTP diphosphatase
VHVTDEFVAAAGVVLWRPGAPAPELAIIHRPKYDDWSLPKGKLEPGEEWRAAAVRETCEETGFTVALGPELPSTRYRDRKGRDKLVRYWAATPVFGSFEANEEVDELRWLTPPQARAQLSYDRDRPLIDALLALPRESFLTPRP